MKASMLTTPGWARQLAGFDHTDLGRRLWFEPTMKVQVAAINWAFGVPANRRLAEARTAGGARRGRPRRLIRPWRRGGDVAPRAGRFTEVRFG